MIFACKLRLFEKVGVMRYYVDQLTWHLLKCWSCQIQIIVLLKHPSVRHLLDHNLVPHNRWSPKAEAWLYRLLLNHTLHNMYFYSEQPGSITITPLLSHGSCGDLKVSVFDSGSSGLGSSPGQGHHVMFLGKTLNSHSTSLHPGA